MEVHVEISHGNQNKKPCECASYVRMRDTSPYCDDPESPYYLRCPADPCAKIDSRKREELLEQRAREQAEKEAAEAERIAALVEADGV